MINIYNEILLDVSGNSNTNIIGVIKEEIYLIQIYILRRNDNTGIRIIYSNKEIEFNG